MKPIKNQVIFLNTSILVIFFSISLPAKSQNASDGSAPQFLLPQFTMSMVKMKNGTSQSVKMNYNTVSEKMVYEKDGQLYNLTNLENVDTVFIQDRKFVPEGIVFHEVLLIAPISLFVQYTGEIVPPGVPAGYGGNSQVSNTKLVSSAEFTGGYYNNKLPPDYLVKVDLVYWLRINNKMQSFINERQLLKIFPGKEGELKQFIKQNKIKFDKMPHLVRLIEFCNGLNQ